VLGTDYTTELTGTTPAGLVSDPARYDRCVSAARGIVRPVTGKPKLTTAQIRVKCRQLNAAIKEQALAFILAGLQTRAEAAAQRIPLPTAAEVTQGMRALIADDYKSEAYFRQVLARQRRTIADVRYEVTTNLITRRLLARIQARAARSGGGEAAAYKLMLQDHARWQERTSCRPGYRAPGCKQFRPGDEAKPPGVQLLELLYKGIA
jgi:hypothetical protein